MISSDLAKPKTNVWNWPRFPLNPFNTLRALNDALDVIFNEEDLEQVVQQLTDPEMKLISSLHLIVA